MSSLKSKTLTYYDYHDMVKHVEKKYKINIRGYAGGRPYCVVGGISPELLKKYQDNVVIPEYVLNAMKNVPEEQRKLSIELIQDGNVPYLDFWHYAIENLFPDFVRGAPMYINWNEFLTETKKREADGVTFDTSDLRVVSLEWVIEILERFVAEFGDKNYLVIIDW